MSWINELTCSKAYNLPFSKDNVRHVFEILNEDFEVPQNASYIITMHIFFKGTKGPSMDQFDMAYEAIRPWVHDRNLERLTFQDGTTIEAEHAGASYLVSGGQ